MGLGETIVQIQKMKMNALGIKSRIISTPVAKQHVYDIEGQGSLPPIVVLHGIGGGSTSFEKVLYILRRFFKRILVPEAPGHGFSEPPNVDVNPDTLYSGIAHIINSELEEPAIIFGNSMGGAFSIYYALDNPERVLGLILSSPGGAKMEEEEWQKFLNTFRLKDILDGVNFMNSLIYKPSVVSLLFGNYLLANLSKPVVQELLDNTPVDYLFTPKQLKQLTMPILMIWGKADRLALPEQREYFREHLPKHAIIDEPEDFGHCPHMDRPIQLAARIIDFAEKIQTSVLTRQK